jgi:signal transduction histidine kinase
MERSPVDVADVVADAVATVRRAEAGADLRADGVPRGLVVAGDRDRLAQALENLLVNALYHGTPPVTVEVTTDDGGTAEEGSRARVRVTDRGGGVPADVQARLFTRFASGTERRGTGLGLFIVRELARAHGGEASYEPDTDEGRSGFVITLPLLRSDLRAPERTSQ